MNGQPVETFLSKYADASGFKPVRFGRAEWRVLCPVHESDGQNHKPSLAVWSRPDGSVAYNCMSGHCNHTSVTKAFADLGLPVQSKPMTRAQRAAARKQSNDHRLARLQEAATVYRGLREIAQDDPAMTYLLRRGFTKIEYGEARMLRTNQRGTELVALLSTPQSIFDPVIELTGLSVLSLDGSGNAILNRLGKKTRQITGVLKGSGCVLGLWNETMVMGEGVETTLAAMRLTGCSFGIATITSSNMINIEPPAGVRSIIVAVDYDDAGELAAKETADARRAQGYRVTTVRWGHPGDDAADEWLRRRKIS